MSAGATATGRATSRSSARRAKGSGCCRSRVSTRICWPARIFSESRKRRGVFCRVGARGRTIQLVGRMKNKLLEFGCDVMTGLPALITGTDMETVTQPDSETRQYFFASVHGCMTLTLEALLAPEFTLDEEKSPAAAGGVMHAGAVLF